MADGNLPDIETLRKLLAYDPETGVLTWKPRPESMFSSARQSRRWNTRYAGKAALTANNGEGYRQGTLFGRAYAARRVAWALYHGEWPENGIDHMNGDRTDNRIANLRDAICLENMRNQKMPTDNTSGAIGVVWCKSSWKWQAQIGVRGRSVYLGLFHDFDAAVAARKLAEREFGFHENHGRKA